MDYSRIVIKRKQGVGKDCERCPLMVAGVKTCVVGGAAFDFYERSSTLTGLAEPCHKYRFVDLDAVTSFSLCQNGDYYTHRGNIIQYRRSMGRLDMRRIAVTHEWLTELHYERIDLHRYQRVGVSGAVKLEFEGDAEFWHGGKLVEKFRYVDQLQHLVKKYRHGANGKIGR